MAKRLSYEDRMWQTSPANTIMLVFLMAMLALILSLFTSYTNNLDEIKPTLQFMFLPLGFLAFFFILYRGEAAPIPAKVWVPLASFFAVSLVSTFLAYHPWRAWFTTGWYWAAVAPFIILASCVKNQDVFRRFMNAYVGLALALILFGLFHYCGGFEWLMDALYPFGPPRNRRVYDLMYTMKSNPEMFSTILNTDFYAAYLVIVFPLAINLMMAPFRAWWEPMLGLATAFLAGISVILTESNDSEGVLFLIVIFYFAMALTIGHVLSKKPDVMWTVGIGGLAVLFTLMTLLWWKLWPQFLSLDTALKARYILWGGGWDIFLHNPILGAGPGGYLVRVPLCLAPNYFENEIANVNLYAHNQYIDVLCEQGVLGFICYMGALGSVVWLGFRQIMRPGSDYLRIHQIGLIAGILGVSIQDFFSPNARWTVCGVNHWAQLGLALSCAMIGMRNEDLAAREETGKRDAQTGASDPPRRSPLGVVSPLWNRRVGLAGMIVAAPVAVISFYFGICYFASAFWNNEGIVSINYASGMSDPELRKGFYEKSIKEFDQAIEWWPGFITSYYKQAHAYSMLGQYQKALEAYDNLSQYAPGYSETWFNYGVVYRVLAQQAQTDADRSKYYRKSLEAFDQAQRMALKLNVQQSVAQTYQVAASQVPDATPEERKKWADHALELLYRVCMRKYKLAEDVPTQKNLRVSMAQTLWGSAAQAEKEKDEEARKRYLGWVVDICGKLIDENDVTDEDIIARKVEAMWRLRQTEAAEKYILSEIADDPDSVMFNQILANHYAETGRYDLASHQWERLSKLLEVCQAFKPVFAASKSLLQANLKSRSQLTPALCLLQAARCASQASEVTRTQELCRETIRVAPGSAEATQAQAFLNSLVSASTSTGVNTPDTATSNTKPKP